MRFGGVEGDRIDILPEIQETRTVCNVIIIIIIII